MPLAGIASGVQASAGLMSLLLGMYPPLLEKYQQTAFKSWPNKLPDLGTVLEILYRGKIDKSEYLTTFAKMGINGTWADRIVEMSEELLATQDLITLWRRGEISEQELDTGLIKLKYNDQTIPLVKKVTEYFPSASDLVTFAVREVYTPETVREFGQLEDLPPKFVTEASKTGMTREQAENYWASHWNLPSVLQGFEMFHRDIIGEPQLKMLMKALDIMPFWRDMLIQMSYTPLTRVDVRRMHAMGILDDQAVYDNYRYGGYSPENAKAMLDFTKQYNADETSGLTRSAVINAYKTRLMSESEVRGVLEAFKYTPEVIQFWIDTADLEMELERAEKRKKDLLEKYRKGAISLSDVSNALSEDDYPVDYITGIIQDELNEIGVKLKMPTKADLVDWLKLQIIDDVYFADQMAKLGYRNQDIENYLTEITFELDTASRKYLPIKTYQAWLAKGILTEERFIEIATAMLLSDEDIANLILEVKDNAEQT